MGSELINLLTDQALKSGMAIVGSILTLFGAQAHKILPALIQLCLTSHSTIVTAVRHDLAPRARAANSLLQLLQRLVDQLLVVFLREIPLNDLRCDGDRQVSGLVANLFERASRLELNLPLGVLDNYVGL